MESHASGACGRRSVGRATVKLAEVDSGVRVTITSPIDREVSWKILFNSIRRGN